MDNESSHPPALTAGKAVGAAYQADLFDGDEEARALFLAIEPDTPKNKAFTGERFRLCHPAKYKVAVRLWTEGVSVAAISELLSVSRQTLSQCFSKIAASQPVEQAKKENAVRWRYLAKLTLGRLEEILLSDNPDKELLKALSVLGGIAEEKAELLSGGATARVEYVEPAAPAPDAIGAYIASLPSASKPRPTQFGEEKTGAMDVQVLPPPPGQGRSADLGENEGSP